MKISKVILHNYRSFPHQEIDFTDGLNTIVGASDAGKSAILKGIRFVLFNDQKGNIFSDWILDSKGKIKKEESCWVEIHTSDGHKVRRERTRTENIYVIDDGEPIKNFNQGVPEDVTKILNMDDVNVQPQSETHFMLKDKSSDVAKTLNKMVNLEIIDDTISNIGKIMRSIKKKRDASDVNLEKYSEEIGKFDFLETMEQDLQELETIEEERSTVTSEIMDLNEIGQTLYDLIEEKKGIEITTKYKTNVDFLLNLFDHQDKEEEVLDAIHNIKESIAMSEEALKGVSDKVGAKPIVDEILALMDTSDLLADEIRELAQCLGNIDLYEEELDTIQAKSKHIELVYEIISLYEVRKNVKNDLDILDEIANTIDDLDVHLVKVKKAIKENSNKIIGEACPMCGGEITEGLC